MKILPYKVFKLVCLSLLISAVSACFHDDDDDDSGEMQMKVFDISLSNLTQSQPFSPPALLLHGSDAMLWTPGESASVALEMMAEGGDASALAELAIISDKQLKEVALAPADSTSWMLEVAHDSTDTLSLATMLVNTNDAFTGVTGMDIAAMEMDEMQEIWLHAYDAGTENNDEAALPGPAATAEGFNPSRDGDVDRVYLHAGILTMHELSGSVLLAEHKFDNPVAKITIKRVQ